MYVYLVISNSLLIQWTSCVQRGNNKAFTPILPTSFSIFNYRVFTSTGNGHSNPYGRTTSSFTIGIRDVNISEEYGVYSLCLGK